MYAALVVRFPLLAAILCAALALFALNGAVTETRSAEQLAEAPERVQMAEIPPRMNRGARALNVELLDGRIDCSTLSYLETASALLPKEYTADLLISNDDGSIVLFAHYEGLPSCSDIGGKPVAGIVTSMEEEAQSGMYATNLMGIRRYPGAQIFRLCGDCTKAADTAGNTTYYWLSAIGFIGFVSSLYLQWRRWRGEWEL